MGDDEPDALDVYFAEMEKQAKVDSLKTKRRREEGRGCVGSNKKMKKGEQQINAIVRLEQGLHTSILGNESTSKALKMMTMMGFKEGQGLGKLERGVKEPVSVEPFLTKGGGVGTEDTVRVKLRERVATEQQARDEVRERERGREEEMRTKQASFRSTLQTNMRVRNVRKDLLKARRVCEELDVKRGVEGGEGWCPVEEAEEDGGEVFDIDSGTSLLSDRLQHLREVHCYCLYCGTRYNDAEDMEANCPGLYEDDH